MLYLDHARMFYYVTSEAIQNNFTIGSLHYRPQRSCGQGNVFTGVSDSVQGGGGVCLSIVGIPHPPGTDTPGVDTPQSRHPLEQTTPPPGADTPFPWADPLEQTPPQKQTPPWSRHPSEQTPQSRRAPRVNTPLEQTPPKADPLSRHSSPPPQEQTPQSRHPPGADPQEKTPLPPGRRHTPPPQPPKQAPAYSQWAAGTYPTGMHS